MSLRAPLKISDAEAEPLFIKTTIGMSFTIVLSALALIDRVSKDKRLFVLTIGPSSMKKSAIFAALSKSPPGLFRKSMISPEHFFSLNESIASWTRGTVSGVNWMSFM